jgi:hypothetical protein
MATINFGEAFTEGFRQIGRRPHEVAAWGFVYFLCAFLPSLLLMAWMLPDMADAFRSAATNPAPSPQMMASMIKMQALQPLMLLGSLVGYSLVYAAIFRAVLRPEEKGFLHLRLSSSEAWLGLVMVVQYVCTVLVMTCLMMVGVAFWIPAIIAGIHHNFSGWEVLPGLLAMLAAFVVLLWLVVRFSMALPMTFATGHFKLFESWTLTRGHSLTLFALALALGVMVVVVMLVLELILGAAVIAAFGLHVDAVKTLFSQPPQTIMQTLAPMFLVVGAILSVFGGFAMTIVAAPWARVYEQLTGASEPAAVF